LEQISRVQIQGIGSALPSRVLTNQELEQMVDTNEQWIIERTGILERRICEPGMATSDYCFRAAIKAMEQAQVSAADLDLIIVATSSPDMMFPSTACLLQERLEAWGAAAFDLEAGCTGFAYALSVAEKFFLSPDYHHILVVGADMCSRFVNYTDRGTCILFGDGAGAVVLGRGSGNNGLIRTLVGADGRGAKFLYMPAGGSALPPSQETVDKHMHSIHMNGTEIFKFATGIIMDVSEKLLASAGFSFSDIDLFVPHQANLRIIKTAIKRANIPLEKTVINIQKYGNMSAASIPVALAEAEMEGRLKAGDLVLMVAFGAGLTYAGALLRWGRE